MKNIKKAILVFVLSLLFITSIKAENFTCDIDGYNVEYDDSGNIVGVIDLNGENLKDYTFHTDFYPKNVSECPGSYAAITRSYKKKSIFVIEKPTLVSTKLSSCADYVTPNACVQNSYYSCEWNGPAGSIGNYCADSVEEEQDKDLGGCNKYTYETSCRDNEFYACVWNETKYGDYCNTDKLLYVKCGDAKDIPYQVPQVISFAVNFLKILTPLILIFVSIITLLKAISSGNEDEMKKAQKGLIRKIIAAVMVFFIISIVQFVIMKVADSEIRSGENGEVETTNLSDCLNCFLNNNCGESVYYKTYIGSDLTETFLSDK